MLRVCISGRNCQQYVRNCLSSVASQTYDQYSVIVTDDASTDGTAAIMREFAEKHGWKLVVNAERVGALCNIISMIEMHSCNDDDVIVLIDADDSLATDEAFSRVAAEYASGARATYGSEKYSAGGFYVPDVPAGSNWRGHNRRLLVHLHTFSYHLFTHIDKNKSFVSSITGKYHTVAHDRLIMVPIAEIAGTNIRRISDVLYAYNNTSSQSDGILHRQLQMDTDASLKTQDPYPPCSCKR